MYICGHPGTGKTSTLNYVLSGFVSGDIKAQLLSKLEVHLYNAMTYSDVKSFCFQLLEDLAKKYAGKTYAEFDSSQKGGLKKRDLDDDETANLVAKTLSAFSSHTKILVIDEIDAFEAYENAFRTMTKAILGSKSNTIIIGIANSVDLPFKKKNSAIAMRDAQLLFEPYDEEQIISIMEQKINMKYGKFPTRLKSGDLKAIFFGLLEDEAAMNVIAKKVAKMYGDARVAFDLLKSSFVELYNRIKYIDPNNISEERKGDEGLMPNEKIRISREIVCKVITEKYSSKLPQTLRCLPRQNLIVLEAIVNIYSDTNSSEDRKISYLELQQEVEALCRQRCLFDLIRGPSIASFMDVLAFYNIIEIENQKIGTGKQDTKKDNKLARFNLKVE